MKELAEEIATMELNYKLELGELNYNKVWEKHIEECHGPHRTYSLSIYGKQEFDKLVDKWVEKIKKYV
jgi:hypothetical protein